MATIIFLALAINGMWIACNEEGMIFYHACNQLERVLPDEVCMPLFRCPTCMSSVYTLAYAALVDSSLWNMQLLFVIPAVACVSTIISSVLEKQNNGL